MARLTIDSPLGPLTLTSRDGAVTALDWGGMGKPVGGEPGGGELGNDPVLVEAARQLDSYFTGILTDFALPLDPAGTAFRQRVWAAMSAVPYGRTATYGDLARRLDTAPRAVGGACGANPLPIIVPCHRVVGGAGAPGGYSGLGGLDTKAWLLAHERRWT